VVIYKFRWIEQRFPNRESGVKSPRITCATIYKRLLEPKKRNGNALLVSFMMILLRFWVLFHVNWITSFGKSTVLPPMRSSFLETSRLSSIRERRA